MYLILLMQSQKSSIGRHWISLRVLIVALIQNKIASVVQKWPSYQITKLPSYKDKIYQVSELLIYQVTKVLSFRVSEFLNFKLSEFLSFRVSKFQSFQVSTFLSFRVSKFPSVWVSKFSSFKAFKFPRFQVSNLPSFKDSKFPSYQVTKLPSSSPPFLGRLADGRKPLGKNCMQWHNIRQQTTDGHRDLETESAQWADWVKIMRHRVLTSIHVHMGVVGKSPQRERNKVVGSVQRIHGRGV